MKERNLPLYIRFRRLAYHRVAPKTYRSLVNSAIGRENSHCSTISVPLGAQPIPNPELIRADQRRVEITANGTDSAVAIFDTRNGRRSHYLHHHSGTRDLAPLLPRKPSLLLPVDR